MQRLLDYQFSDPKLLKKALSHRSAGQCNNERLEFLGDALLGLIIAETLYTRFPSLNEGSLSRLRAKLVKRETLADLARLEQLERHLILGGGESKSGGWRRDSILANTMEALIGGIYLDSDFYCCRDWVLKIYTNLLNEVSPDDISRDSKTALQEYLQGRGCALPVYSVTKKTGLPHECIFTIRCTIEGLETDSIGTGKSKRLAEREAAKLALKALMGRDREGQG